MKTTEEKRKAAREQREQYKKLMFMSIQPKAQKAKK